MGRLLSKILESGSPYLARPGLEKQIIPSELVVGGTGLSYSRGQADRFDKIIVLHRSGEFQQHDVVYSKAQGSLTIVRVVFLNSHGYVLTIQKEISQDLSDCLTHLMRCGAEF